MNSNIANFLRTKFDISLESASLGISLYFASLMAGRFTGAILLRRISSAGFLVFSVILTFIGLAGLLLSGNITLSRIMIVVAGLGFSNTFPIIFAMIVGRMPEYSNELSSLIILSVIGGAVIPPVMGLLSDHANVTVSMSVLVVCMIYVGVASLYAIRTGKQQSDTP
jgi:fucose permease